MTQQTPNKNGRGGPKTPRGKLASSRNAVKHGCLSKKAPALLSEDLGEYEKIRTDLEAQFRPYTALDRLMLGRMAVAWLRLARVWRVESACADLQMLEIERSKRFPDVMDLMCRGDQPTQDVEEFNELTDAIYDAQQRAAGIDLRKIELLQGYETRILKEIQDCATYFEEKQRKIEPPDGSFAQFANILIDGLSHPQATLKEKDHE
jgi:hypothetical protein